MENQRSFIAFLRGILLLLVVILYLIGLAIWTPLFLLWPQRYASMTFSETLATRWVLVRHIWANLVRTAAYHHLPDRGQTTTSPASRRQGHCGHRRQCRP